MQILVIGFNLPYGIGSSQYNRIRVPSERIGGTTGEELRYLELGHSEAFGTSQYADDTVEDLFAFYACC